MTTYEHTTVSNTVTVTDRDAVESLLNDYRWPVDLTPELSRDGELQIRGYRPLMCYGHSDGQAADELAVAEEPRLEEFFEALPAYIPPGVEFFVQDIAALDLRNPVHAEEWIITSTGAEQHTLPHSL